MKDLSKRWIWVFTILTALMLGGTIAILVLAAYDTENLPDHIDVVLFQRSTLPRDRFIHQAKAVRKNMEFIERIYVLHPDPGKHLTHDESLNLTYVHLETDNAQEAFMKAADMYSNEELDDRHIIFLSDQTLPWSTIHKTYLFSGDQARMFSAFRNAAVTTTFIDYFESQTTSETAVLVEEASLIRSSDNDYTKYLFRASTEQRVILRNDLSRDIFAKSNMQDNFNTQATELDESPPLFVTFHVTGSVDLSYHDANRWINDYLSTHEVTS